MQEQILLKDFLNFIIKPTYLNDQKLLSVKWKIFNCLKLLSWVLLINIFYSVALTIVLIISHVQESNSVANAIQQTPIFAIVYGIFIGPVIEETIFRLPMKFKPMYLAFFLFFIVLELIDKIINLFGPIRSLGVLGIIGLVSLIVSLVFYVIIKQKPIYNTIDNFYKKHYRWVFYFFAFVFGFFHLNNFQNLGTMLLFIPFLTLTQVFAGFALGYIRMKYGYVWGIFNHILNNSSIFLFVLITSPVSVLKIVAAIILIVGFIGLCIFSIGTLLIDFVAIVTQKRVIIS